MVLNLLQICFYETSTSDGSNQASQIRYWQEEYNGRRTLMGGMISNGREGSDVSPGGGIKVFINQESASSSLFWRFIATKLSSSHWNRRLRSLQSFNFQNFSLVLGFHRRWGLCLRPQSGQSGGSVLVTFPCSWRGSVVQSASTCNAVTSLVRWWQCD